MISRQGILMLLLGFWASGCGYTFQNSKNPLLEKRGIEKVYVAPFANNSAKPGVETVVYNSLLKSLRAHGRIRIVEDIELADAVLTGTVGTASYSPYGATGVAGLNPSGLGDTLPTRPFSVATVYSATLGCSFSLSSRTVSSTETFEPAKKEVKIEEKHKPYTWGASFSRSAQFPGSNQLGTLGSTSPLINESEFDRVLVDLAHSMMDDVNESMLAMF